MSPAFCVGIQHPSFRFFARRTGGTWGVLNVKLRYTGADGVTNETTVGSVSAADAAWHPTAPLALSTVLGLWNGDQSASVQIVLDPEDYGGFLGGRRRLRRPVQQGLSGRRWRGRGPGHRCLLFPAG